MEKTHETSARPYVQDEIIVLGVASVETKGGGIPGGEELGETVLPGISDQ